MTPTTKNYGGARRSDGREKVLDGQARLAVNLPSELHRKIKVRAAQRGLSMRDYILMLLKKDGIS